MNLKELNQLFQRDLEKLGQELEAYRDEANIWAIDKEITNSAGNLTLHLFGNLRHFLGLEFGGIAYQRNRTHEFEAKGESRTKMLEELKEVKRIVETALLNLDSSRLGDKSQHDFFGHSMSIGFFLTHLYGHLNYHLGQINYHRRLLG